LDVIVPSASGRHNDEPLERRFPVQKTKKARSEILFPYFMCAPALVLFITFVIVPFCQGIFISLFRWDGLSAMKWIGVNNYKFVLADVVFWGALKNTFVYAITVTVLKNIFGLALAIILVKKVFCRNMFRTVVYMPVTFSYIVIGVLWSWVYNPQFGILNALLSALNCQQLIGGWLSDPNIALFSIAQVDIWKWTGFHMVLYLGGLQNIPHDYYEAASIDGANKIRQFLHITVPQLNGSIVANVLLSMLGAFTSNYDLVKIMTGGGPYHSTEVMSTYMISTGVEFSAMGKANAISVLLFLCVFTFGFLQIKLMTRDSNYDN
jgi:raffinose/stachyose/melibiose transport system permease protein